MTFCEYADGPLRQIERVATVPEPEDLFTPLVLDVGSSLDCGADQEDPPPLGIVNEILVPGGSSGPEDPAFYDVWTTLAFGGAAEVQASVGN